MIMIYLIFSAYMTSNNKLPQGIAEVIFVSTNEAHAQAKLKDLQVVAQADSYLALYECPLDTDLSTLPHYPSIEFTNSDFQ